MPLHICGDSTLRVVTISEHVAVNIVENEALEQLLFDRTLVGLPFRRTCTRISEEFLRHAAPEIAAADEDIAELVILTKGLYYNVAGAFAHVYERNLECNFIATKRHVTDGDQMDIEVAYRDYSAPASTLIVSDTVASGRTVCRALEDYCRHADLRRVLVFSAAGSAEGATRITNFCSAAGVQCLLFFGLAAFGLADNGFDLSFLDQNTICPNGDYLARARATYMDTPVSVVGWDFGSQAQAVGKYRALCWLEACRWGLEASGLFAMAQRPADWHLVEKERAAFERWVEFGTGNKK